MLAQYRQIKARFPDALVLFRLGDFYETFEADARTAARELELVLTSRSFAKGVRLPMAGVPHHHVQSYIAKLIEKGYKVALVEQLEDPKKVKRLVKRDVIRIITPGTVVEDALLRAKSDNYLAAIVRNLVPAKGGAEQPAATFGLAIVDISTGEFATTQIEGADAESKLVDELQRIQASEYVLPQSLAGDAEFAARLKAIRPARLSPIDDRVCEEDRARRELCEHFAAATLAPFGCEELPLAIAAANAILEYLKTNQPSPLRSPQDAAPLQYLNHLWTFSLADYMMLDSATRRNLELTAPIHDGRDRAAVQRSLFGVLDETVTAMGARLLKRWIQQPLLDLAQIHARLDAVEELHDDAFLREDLRKALDGLYDVERLVGRIGFGNANARDLIGLKRALVRLPQIKARLLGQPGKEASRTELLRRLGEDLDELQDVANLIDRALVDDPPIFIREGGLIRSGHDAALDELREGAARGKAWLGDLEEKEKQRTGIKNLRVRYNEVFGYFIEVPRSAGHMIPRHYERRATISHAERYVTPELKTQEANILANQDRVKDLEYELFVAVRSETARHSARLQRAARILAQLDVLLALAEAAARYHYIKPLVDEGDAIEILEGRHPVVERFLREGETFVPNDVRLDGDSHRRVIILTGPNMSGKSVFVRQVALIVLMAQIGSMVPASFARIGLTDRIFTRVGASDDIAQGRSTFLVEMSETSHILRHATTRSLIVLDEVGRGTSTYDGISLAWAIAEEIHNIVGAKTLFATHYHELTLLESDEGIREHGGAVKNYTMAVKEQGKEVVFLRQVIEGGAEKSFGIHVARLAGLPERVVGRAESVLRELEAGREQGSVGVWESGSVGVEKREGVWESGSGGERMAVAREDGELYSVRAALWREVLRQIAEVDIANLTPVQALNLLNDMQVRLRAGDETS
jgi:DNA mismatch repair protein MutS